MRRLKDCIFFKAFVSLYIKIKIEIILKDIQYFIVKMFKYNAKYIDATNS